MSGNTTNSAWHNNHSTSEYIFGEDQGTPIPGLRVPIPGFQGNGKGEFSLADVGNEWNLGSINKVVKAFCEQNLIDITTPDSVLDADQRADLANGILNGQGLAKLIRFDALAGNDSGVARNSPIDFSDSGNSYSAFAGFPTPSFDESKGGLFTPEVVEYSTRRIYLMDGSFSPEQQNERFAAIKFPCQMTFNSPYEIKYKIRVYIDSQPSSGTASIVPSTGESSDPTGGGGVIDTPNEGVSIEYWLRITSGSNKPVEWSYDGENWAVTIQPHVTIRTTGCSGDFNVKFKVVASNVYFMYDQQYNINQGAPVDYHTETLLSNDYNVTPPSNFVAVELGYISNQNLPPESSLALCSNVPVGLYFNGSPYVLYYNSGNGDSDLSVGSKLYIKQQGASGDPVIYIGKVMTTILAVCTDTLERVMKSYNTNSFGEITSITEFDNASLTCGCRNPIAP